MTECPHTWVDEYYGTKCQTCGTFYPFGCAPWDCDVRDGFDLGDDSEEPDEWDDYEEDGPLDLEDQLERALDIAFPVTKQ